MGELGKVHKAQQRRNAERHTDPFEIGTELAVLGGLALGNDHAPQRVVDRVPQTGEQKQPCGFRAGKAEHVGVEQLETIGYIGQHKQIAGVAEHIAHAFLDADLVRMLRRVGRRFFLLSHTGSPLLKKISAPCVRRPTEMIPLIPGKCKCLCAF